MRVSIASAVARLNLVSGTTAGGYGLLLAANHNPVIAAVTLVGLGYRRLRRSRRGKPSSHGTARIADYADLAAAGMLGGEGGLIVGRAGPDTRPTRLVAIRSLFSLRTPSADATRAFLVAFFGSKGFARRFIRVRDYVHLCTFAPTGRGKSVSVLEPNLHQYAGGTVTVDPDGELFRRLGETRRSRFGHRNIVLAPFGIPGMSRLVADTLNPLTFLDPNSPHFLDDCSDLASMIVVRKGTEPDSHWLDSAELVLTGFIAFVVACEPVPELRNFQVIRDLVSSREKFTRAVEAMRKVDGFGGVITRLGNMMGWYVDRELGSIMSTLQRVTRFLDSPVVAECTARSSFDPAILRGKASAWLCLPADKMENLAPLMRLWLGVILRQLTRDGADESKKVLFLIDEAAHIGHMKPLEDAVTLMRKRGIRLWFFFQSIGQLSKCFGERAGVFLDNIDTQQYFGINSFESAEAISKRMGETTILVASESANDGTSRQTGGGNGSSSGGSSSGTGVSVSEQGRRLLKPEEIMLQETAIVFHRNLPPIVARLPLSYADPEFKPGWKGDRSGVGFSALVLSIGWLIGGGGVLAWASGSLDVAGLPQPASPVIAGWRASWQGWTMPGGWGGPSLTPAEIDAEFENATLDAMERAASRLEAGNQLSGGPLPRQFRPDVIEADRAAEVAAAYAEADRKRRLYRQLHPGSRRPMATVAPDGPADAPR